MGKINRLLLMVILLILVILAMLISPVSAFATISAPDSVAIDNYYVYRNLIESRDSLFIFQYNFVYSAYPTTSIDQCFAVRLLSSDGSTELGAALPFAYANYGYGRGIVALYFDSSDGVVWGTAYKVRINGNPSQFDSPPTYDFDLPVSAYTTHTTQSENQTALGNTIFSIARTLQQAWGSSYVLTSQQDSGTCLSTQGEDYFRNAVYGLQIMAPQIFYLQSAEVVQDVPTQPGTSLSDTYKARFDGTWVKTSLQGGADLLSVPLSVFIFILCILGCGFLVYFSKRKFNNPYPGYFTSAIWICGCTLLIMGFTFIALLVFVAVFIGGWLLFFRRA